ncbi:hypothetical protein LJC14_07315 [Treponema sp. OttesenSCG-928-L16]|nr:hypothetical protein [Treponema sp. OttesenSCG-928-L16]
MLKSSIDERDIWKNILHLCGNAGFIRPGIISPFEPAFTVSRVFDGPLPENYREGALSLLVTALAYGNQEGDRGPEKCPNPAYIAPFARKNYYREAVKRLQGISLELRRMYGGRKADYRILCNSPVPEKPLALAAGVGSLGRNGLIITREAGSLVILAAMTLPFSFKNPPPDVPYGDRVKNSESETAERDRVNPSAPDGFPLCAGCDRINPPCKAACPTGALRGDGSIDLSRCIQWYASGKGDRVIQEVAEKWGQRLYGCTCCQDACIHNKRPIQGAWTKEGILPACFDAERFIRLPDEEIKNLFKDSTLGLSWLSPEALRRSARLALGIHP